jgi:hypothetical protein
MANFLRQAVSAVRGYTEKAKQVVADGGAAKPIGSELMPMREFRKELMEKMEQAAHRPGLCAALPERRLLRRREEARRDPADGDAGAEDRGPRRDRFRTGHRRAARGVAEGVNSLIGPNLGALLITHYQRLLNYIKPHFVHVFYNGQIVMSGGPELAHELEAKGYEWIREQFGEPVDGQEVA